MTRRSACLAAAVLTSCMTDDKGCELPVQQMAPQDCAALSEGPWRIGPFPTATEPELRLATGESRLLWLNPFVDPGCAASVDSVTWSARDPSLASFDPRQPAYDGAWITGREPGSTTVRARIVFADGRVLQPERALQLFVRAPREGSSVVAEGTIELDGRGSRYVPFTLPRPARFVDARLDWTSVWSLLDFALFSGACGGTAAPACAGLLATPSVANVKPLPLTVSNLPEGPYTLRIDCGSSTRETVRYEVRLTPG